MFFFACFFLFSQLHSPLCAFKKEINNLKKHYKNFKDINSNSLLQSFCALFTSRKRHSSVAQNLSQSTYRSTIGERTTRYSRNNSIAGCTAQTYPLLFPMLERLIVVSDFVQVAPVRCTIVNKFTLHSLARNFQTVPYL